MRAKVKAFRAALGQDLAEALKQGITEDQERRKWREEAEKAQKSHSDGA